MKERKKGGVTRDGFVTPRGAELKVEFQAKLKGASAAGVGDMAKGTFWVDAIRCAVGGAAISGEEELRRVGDSKGFEPEFHIIALCETDRFGKRGVKVEEVGAAQVVAADIAEDTVASRSREAGCREPRVVGIGADAVTDLYGGNEIRSLSVARRLE